MSSSSGSSSDNKSSSISSSSSIARSQANLTSNGDEPAHALHCVHCDGTSIGDEVENVLDIVVAVSGKLEVRATRGATMLSLQSATAGRVSEPR